MEAISNVASGFIGLFQAGGETFMGWVQRKLRISLRKLRSI